MNMRTTENAAVEGPETTMHEELAALRRTCDLLKERVEQLTDGSGTGFTAFEENAYVQRIVDERVAATRAMAERSKEENQKRARIEALLNDIQQLACVGGWMFDLATESMQSTDELYRILELEPGAPLSIEQTLSYYHDGFRQQVELALCDAIGAGRPFDLEGTVRTAKGNDRQVRVRGRVYKEDDRASRILGLISDVTEQKLVEARMSQAQKMESVGQLAAGIAHEINTPTQFVGDNLRFLQTAFQDIAQAMAAIAEATAQPGAEACAPAIGEALRVADWDFLRGEVPTAIAQALEGVERVAGLVRAMKDFAHPGSEQKEYADLNRAIASTTTVARNEWKYVAELNLELAEDLPRVPCYLADVNQVVLNMVVNAAHAIEERRGKTGEQKGTITVRTRVEEPCVVIEIEDDGNGMPEHVKARIFDPFFTTKGVGKGTGQGLSISHQVVVKRHQGSIDVRSQVGVGTTMIVRLPLAASGATA
jgi:signal transduction histidine kinase